MRLQRARNLVELGLEGGREAVVHKVWEVGLQERGQHAAQALRMQRLALLADVLAVLRPASSRFWQNSSQSGYIEVYDTAGTAELCHIQAG